MYEWLIREQFFETFAALAGGMIFFILLLQLIPWVNGDFKRRDRDK